MEHLKGVKKMKCTLMNKNAAVVELELDVDTAAIIKIIASLDLAYLPIGISVRDGIPNRKELNDWWYGRAIPASRSGIRSALEKMEIDHPEQLLTRCCGLSLSDQYWMRPEHSGLTWAKINFFENEFSDDVGDILFGHPVMGNIDMMSPCNTSDGWLKKRWKIAEGKRYLIKGGSNPYMQEPLNEAAATRLHQRLGCENYVKYSLLWDNGIPYSICEDFIDVDTELVSAVSINQSRKRRSQYSVYEHFIAACEELGIPGMKEHMNYLLVFDYLMANTDRHFGNLGAIRDVNTLKWIGPAPVFDSGTSLWHDKLTGAINGYTAVEAKPFYASAEKQMELITDYNWIPFEELQSFGEDIREIFILSKFMDEERIEAIVSAVQVRVEELQRMAMEYKTMP